MLGFERLVASRYFALGRRRGWRMYTPCLVVGLLLVLDVALSYWLNHDRSVTALELRAGLGPVLLFARLVLIVLLILVTKFTLLASRLTIFTTISVYGMFLGSGALVIVLSVMSGFEHDLKRKILGTNAHVVVTRPDQPFADYRRLDEALARLPGVVGATPYTVNEVMIQSQSNLSGVVVKGIDPDSVGKATDLVRNIELGGLDYLVDTSKLRDLAMPPAGHGDDGDDDEPLPRERAADQRLLPGVIIGRELAKNLRVYLGDDVSIISPFGGVGPSGAIPKSKPFRVAGIFYSGMYEYDTKYVYLNLPVAQRFFDLGGAITGIELKLANPDRTEPIVATVGGLVDASYEVRDWKALNRSLFSALRIERILMFVLLCFIVLVAAFSMIANGTMLVMEKGHEIAILKSIGASNGMVVRAFLLLGLFIGAIGTVTGIVLGIVGCLALGHFGLPLNTDVYYLTTLPVKMNPAEILLVLFAALAIALLATLYPAWLAARLRPVAGLRDAQR